MTDLELYDWFTQEWEKQPHGEIIEVPTKNGRLFEALVSCGEHQVLIAFQINHRAKISEKLIVIDPHPKIVVDRILLMEAVVGQGYLLDLAGINRAHKSFDGRLAAGLAELRKIVDGLGTDDLYLKHNIRSWDRTMAGGIPGTVSGGLPSLGKRR